MFGLKSSKKRINELDAKLIFALQRLRCAESSIRELMDQTQALRTELYTVTTTANKELQEIRAYLGVDRVEVFPTPERTVLKKVRISTKRSGQSK